jgi:hypothetical protein
MLRHGALGRLSDEVVPGMNLPRNGAMKGEEAAVMKSCTQERSGTPGSTPTSDRAATSLASFLFLFCFFKFILVFCFVCGLLL